MQRVDLYGTVHKGLRAALFATARDVAATDFSQAPETAAAAAGVERLLAFLAEHAEHEDDAILPAIARVAPELQADLAAEHARVEGLGAELGRIAERLASASETERVSLGRRLHERMGLFVAEQLQHMAREEGQANRVLWAHFSDPELKEIEQRIVGAIPPARMAAWMELMLPAMNLAERAELVGELTAAVPADVLAQLLAGARAALGEPVWERTLQAAAGVSMTAGGAR
jgi:hypothetical protein